MGVIIFINFLFVLTAVAKNVDDVVVLKNGDRLTGEIKGLQSGELRFKSDYMAEAVRLDWSRVERLESKSTFMIWLVDSQPFASTGFARKVVTHALLCATSAFSVSLWLKNA